MHTIFLTVMLLPWFTVSCQRLLDGIQDTHPLRSHLRSKPKSFR